ncbi:MULTISPECIES: hypothetical protein [unclassified Bacillus (in: firmicutes)]|uniref:hypothetical protein n=1 Tax=unclassified Bacillus (in: firmicutes) TaxID=185979 RepID=UPI001BEBD8D0|nr:MULTISPECIES: hypothetical protein [unclassified Bacillus (in: firmicutes)]MBT2618454.1 hypothetical protein [Bacillus sp. ISL-78]MBT2630681.1 hypothetical protein [Bacillus sp. ISL-101]
MKKMYLVFYLPNIQKWLTYEEGMKTYTLKPSYSIHQSTLDYKGYVEIQVPKNEVVFYPFIDYLFEIWGVENIRVREQNETVLLYVRTGEKPLISEVFCIADILPYLTNGEMHHDADTLILRSPNRKTILNYLSNCWKKLHILLNKKELVIGLSKNYRR